MARSARQMETPDQHAPQGALRDDRIAAPSSPWWGATPLQAWDRSTRCNGMSGKSPDGYRRFRSRRVQPCNEGTSGLRAYRALLSAIICSKASTIRRRVPAPLQWAPPSQPSPAHFTATSLKVNTRNITPDAGFPPETHSSSAAASSRTGFAVSRSTCLRFVITGAPFDLTLKDLGSPILHVSTRMTVTYVTIHLPTARPAGAALADVRFFRPKAPKPRP
jgi:hypothetical protein